jgi:hypothetical protein
MASINGRALYHDRFRLAEEHRDKVRRVLELGSQWTLRVRSAPAGRIWLEVALVPSAPPNASWTRPISAGCPASSKSIPGQAPSPIPYSRVRRADTRGAARRLRLEKRANSTALEAYADGSVHIRAEMGWPPTPTGSAPCSTSRSRNTGCCPCSTRQPGIPNGPARTGTSPVHATSTLDALASDATQLQACARRMASDLLADLGHVETTLLKPDGKILSARLDPAARENLKVLDARYRSIRRS